MEPKPTDLIFGTSGEPGLLRACFRMVLANKTARWEVSKPLDLKTFLSQFQHLEDKKVARKGTLDTVKPHGAYRADFSWPAHEIDFSPQG